MRPLEILLWFAELLAFAAWAAPWLRGRRWARGLAVAAVAIAGLQLAAEGARWQMLPAYGLAGLLLLPALRKGARPAPSGPRRFWTYGLAGVGALALVVAAALPAAFPVFRFAPPPGPHGIGTLTYHWVDTGRPELFTAEPGDRRELMVQVWYPALTERSAPRAPYLQDSAVLEPLARLLRLPGFALGHLRLVTTNAVAAAPAAAGRHPVLVFSHGRGGYRQHNTFQVEALVSQGYVVAAIDHPYAAAGVVFPDGRRADLDRRMLERAFIDRMIPYLAQDVGFALDRLATLDQADPKGVLTGRLDLTRTGIFGVSLGGAVTATACRADPRLRACLAMDVFMPADVVASGLKQPTLWISRDAETMRLEGWTPSDITETQTTMRAVFDSLPGDGYLALIPGAFHPNFSDAPLLAAAPVGRALGLIGPVDPRRAHKIVNGLSLAFFDRHLKGAPAALLDDPSQAYPEIRFKSRR